MVRFSLKIIVGNSFNLLVSMICGKFNVNGIIKLIKL
jgi:hypothetical protein